MMENKTQYVMIVRTYSVFSANYSSHNSSYLNIIPHI